MLPRQSLKSLGLVVDADVGVFHRHPHIAVAGKLLDFRDRRPVTEKFRDVRVATCGVKLSDPCFGLNRGYRPAPSPS